LPSPIKHSGGRRETEFSFIGNIADSEAACYMYVSVDIPPTDAEASPSHESRPSTEDAASAPSRGRVSFSGRVSSSSTASDGGDRQKRGRRRFSVRQAKPRPNVLHPKVKAYAEKFFEKVRAADPTETINNVLSLTRRAAPVPN